MVPGDRRAAAPGQGHLLLGLQASAGNRAVSGLIQAKREDAHPGDPRRRDADDHHGEARSAPDSNERLPETLRAELEQLSGLDLSDVRVRYNSNRPAQLGALAYTKGREIELAPGEQRQLPHEAWHVVQQAEGRVDPTHRAEGHAINDHAELEQEADAMGAKLSRISDHRTASEVGSPAVAHQMRPPAANSMAAVAQLATCQYCKSQGWKSNHKEGTPGVCPLGGPLNPKGGSPKQGKGERDMRKREGHGMMTKEQARRYVPGY